MHPNVRDTRQARAAQTQPAVPAISSPETDNEEDVTRPPESGSDDEKELRSEGDTTSGSKVSSPQTSSPLKRKSPEQTARSKPKRPRSLQDKPDTLPSQLIHSGISEPSSQPDWLSSTLSQKRTSEMSKLRKTYGRKTGAPVFDRKPQIAETTSHKPTSKLLQLRGDQREQAPEPATKPQLDLSRMDVPLVEDKQPNLAVMKKLDIETDLGSSASTAASDIRVLDLASSPDLAQRTKLSTPLTSEDSDEDEAGIKTTAPPQHVDEPTTMTCPACRATIDCSMLPADVKDLRSLSIRVQQDICHQHRLSEAKVLAEKRAYPEIDWDCTEHQRIPGFIDHLRKVLSRKKKSFYQEELDRQVASSKKKPKLLREYLLNGVLDVATPGYYGPKGEKVMSHVITQEMATDLRQAIKKDSGLRAAGVGPYVAAVLVPELAMQLVMQDLGSDDQDRAREILAESTDVGRLLSPDDDHVELDEL